MILNEWQFEPNHMTFVHNGLTCEIERHDWGYFNCYVYLPDTNIYHSVDYDHITTMTRGLIKHDITWGSEKNGKWCFGISFSSIKDYIPNEPDEDHPLDGYIKFFENVVGKATQKDYRNLEYAIEQVKLLAEFLSNPNVKKMGSIS